MSNIEFYKNSPTTFASAVSEPAFMPENVTFCLWASYEDQVWQYAVVDLPTSEDSGSSEFLLSNLNGRIETYRNFALDYYEQDIPLATIQEIYNHSKLTDKIVPSLNSEIGLAELSEDLSIAG